MHGEAVSRATRPPDKPNFLVLGAAKCGTTSLCAALARHPDVFFSEPKEPVFFEREYEQGLDYYWEEYFSGWDGQSAVGEGRVYNLYLPFVPPRIRESLPEARLICILRDPVERAHSHWWHRVTRGYERRSFEEVVREELAELAAGDPFQVAGDPETWKRNFFPGTRGTHADVREVRFLEMGHYADQLRRYFDLFPTERLRVLFFEELVPEGDGRAEADPTLRREALRDLFAFLGVDPEQAPLDLPRENVGRQRVKGRTGFLLERLSWILGLGRFLPKRLRTAVRRKLSRSAERPPPSPEARRALLDHYTGPNEELRRLVGRRPDAWDP